MLVKNLKSKLNKPGLQLRTYFQGYLKITFFKGGGTRIEGHGIHTQEEQ